jgi:hypothetical protein
MLAVNLLAACATTPSTDPYTLNKLPTPENFCLDAQRVVGHTTIPMQVVIHKDLPAFVKSKALIEGPTIQQFNWYDPDGNIQGYSCKMKSTDHLNAAFGAGSAGAEGYCRTMNEQVYTLVSSTVADPVFDRVIFDSNESADDPEPSKMTGPQWLLPYTLTSVDAAGHLHVAASGFVIEFTDPRYQRFPPSWRGTHYCHLIAPEYLVGLLSGNAKAGAVVGQIIPRELMVPVDESH